eukprot:scaffold8107_cov363-Prasinococcus_capsulatus_cf.AAC.1
MYRFRGTGSRPPAELSQQADVQHVPPPQTRPPSPHARTQAGAACSSCLRAVPVDHAAPRGPRRAAIATLLILDGRAHIHNGGPIPRLPAGLHRPASSESPGAGLGWARLASLQPGLVGAARHLCQHHDDSDKGMAWPAPVVAGPGPALHRAVVAARG